ncbi:MAG: MFS transporter [Minisyncoccia bacterium]
MNNRRKIIYFAGFLFSITLALTSYINSSFLETYINEYYVSAIYIISSIITIWGFFKMPKILTHLGNRFTTFILGICIFLSLILLATGNKILIIIPAFILYFISTNLIIASLDIFIEDFSKSSSIGKIRGIYLMIINSAWVVAQIISGSIITKTSFRGIYLFSALFMILFSIIFVFFLNNFKDPKYKKVPILKTTKFFLQNKNVSAIYIINLILKFFYAWMVIYTPIYLHEYLSFGWDKIGIIFSIMLIPFVILDFPLGKLSDKIGEKKMMLVGFLVTILSTLAIPLINEPKLIVWAGILFLTRVGAATIEVLSESYFFKIISEENADAINFFRNTTPLSYIIAPLFAIPILLLVPSFEYLFFILGVILIYGFLITLKIKDVK